MIFTNKWLLSLVIISAFTLASCGKKDQAESAKADTQVVAKVNNDEISIHQINFQLGRLAQSGQKPLNEAQSKEAAKQILTRLVDQQLLKQQAIEAKLDRDPRILQVIETSKSEILAQAYLEQLLSKATKPTTAQIDTFYKENPALFVNRRVFRLQELAVNVPKDKYAEVEENAKKLKNINEVAAWLKTQNYPFNANSNVRAAEQLPLDFLKQIQPLKDGEIVIVQTNQSINIVHIAASQSMPIARDKATPIIEQYFLNQSKSALAKKEMATLTEKAKIEFVGAFADMKKGQPAAPVAIKKSDTQSSTESNGVVTNEAPKSTQQVAKTAEADKSKSTSTQSNMDKGLAGF
ncbi:MULTISPECIES: EpsD family peptidyl-prolyl cis-trans isomerase [Methylotenera]|uniref:EpsD family peptidyl-prolyl cis-trans isomerase n=1 Tax=Methylotenera TaxID=359407 RepID=UPI00036959DC|nr:MULTISPECIES: EpsD family peptidyl-prolyl cis-trans isomerase [Methylotenera]